MQGIQLFHYNDLLNQLQKLKVEGITEFPCEHSDLINVHEEKLKEIYINYKKAREEVALTIKQFEEHKFAIRRLMTNHKQIRKTLIKNQKVLQELS